MPEQESILNNIELGNPTFSASVDAASKHLLASTLQYVSHGIRKSTLYTLTNKFCSGKFYYESDVAKVFDVLYVKMDFIKHYSNKKLLEYLDSKTFKNLSNMFFLVTVTSLLQGLFEHLKRAFFVMYVQTFL